VFVISRIKRTLRFSFEFLRLSGVSHKKLKLQHIRFLSLYLRA
jgi:hypothetical protein